MTWILGHVSSIGGVDITWFVLAIWILMLLVMSMAVYFMIIMLRRSAMMSRMSDPKAVAEKRFANGEITEDELDKILEALSARRQ